MCFRSGSPRVYLLNRLSFFEQGFVITLPYCFLNTEVRNVLKHNLHRWQANRNWNRSGGGGGGAAGLGGPGGYPRHGNASARKNCHKMSKIPPKHFANVTVIAED